MSHETVAILGASANPARYSNRAQHMLIEHGHSVIPVNPQLDSVDGVPCVPDLQSIGTAVDTVTVYLRPDRQHAYTDQLLRLAPRRVIFNPGSENPALRATLEAAGIDVQWACTLVLLRTGQFELAA